MGKGTALCGVNYPQVRCMGHVKLWSQLPAYTVIFVTRVYGSAMTNLKDVV